MRRAQLRVLYREFLFRIVDVELLSAQADTGRLLGQLGGILGVLSLVLSVGAFLLDSRGIPRPEFLIMMWGAEHFLISTTMLVVGLFAVLSWEATFPTKRDLLILAPLPVSTPTLFFAKIAATGSGLGVAVLAINMFTGVGWPLALAGGDPVLLSLTRAFLAYWLTMFAAGLFVFCSALAVQGVAAQLLPHWFFLRVSAVIQVTAFTVLVSAYFMEPHWANPTALGAPQNQAALHWLPSYWFLALFEFLNGSLHPVLIPLVRWSLVGLLAAVGAAVAAFGLSYFRTIRKIVEEPDVVPKSIGLTWAPLPGKGLRAAIVQFAIRTMIRSRQHRATLCFYLGIALAITVFYTKTGIGQTDLQEASKHAFWHLPSVPLLVSSVVILCMMIIGLRVAFAMPIELKANWIFRASPMPGTSDSIAVSRRALLILGVAPVCIVSGGLLFSLWPWQAALGHIGVLILVGSMLTDILLRNFQKIPFTCSYLPGKSNVYFVFWFYVLFAIPILHRAMRLERHLLQSSKATVFMLLALLCATVCVRWFVRSAAGPDFREVQFEDDPPSALFTLNLHKDGVL